MTSSQKLRATGVPPIYSDEKIAQLLRKFELPDSPITSLELLLLEPDMQLSRFVIDGDTYLLYVEDYTPDTITDTVKYIKALLPTSTALELVKSLEPIPQQYPIIDSKPQLDRPHEKAWHHIQVLDGYYHIFVARIKQ